MHTMQAAAEMTGKQEEVWTFIQDFKASKGYSPAQREIQGHFKFASRNAVPKHLKALRKKGLLGRPTRRARSLTSTLDTAAARMMKIPLLGAIPAGIPSDQRQEIEGSVTVDAEALRIPKNARVFALQVRGDSMKDAAIIDGDTVVIEACEARDKDIVAALIDGEVTLKRYLLQRGKPFLRAENEKYSDLIPAQELIIQGVFRALIRPNTRRI